MNQSALKTFAQDARNKLRQLIGARLDYVLTADTAELRQQTTQVKQLRAALRAEGRDPLIERVAYTWFNRLAALRFMDANGYHPFGARVITPATANETLPELLQQASAGALDADLGTLPLSLSPSLPVAKSPHRPVSSSQSPTVGDAIASLLSGRIPADHPEAQVFKLLLVAACNYYHRLMPFLFEKIGDATELLLPDDLLTEQSIVADFRENLTDEDCRNEEVLGWFYQYYISEKKDEVMARNAAVPKNDIPAVTQLFTPHWIVRYLVENSLGRLWLLNRPQSKLREKMPYFIDDEETGRHDDRGSGRTGEGATNHPLSPSPAHPVDFLRIQRPEEIKLLDPASGSGHMLTYAFDLLYAIYEEEGYDSPEIPGLILRHNVYGVDICDRAVALAAFALSMKARAKDNRFFRRVVQPHLISLQEIHFEEVELREYISALGLPPVESGQWPVGNNSPADHYPLTTDHFLRLLHQFEEAKNFGSLIQPCLDENGIVFARGVITDRWPLATDHFSSGQLFLRETHAKVLRVLEQAEYLCQRYHVVVANPPYMGGKGMNIGIKNFLKEHFSDYNGDLFAPFIVRSLWLALTNGYLGFMSPFVWMFISSHEKLRLRLIDQANITTLVQLEYSGFDGATVPICTFTLQNRHSRDFHGSYVRLSDFPGSENQAPKTLEAIGNPSCGWFYRAKAEDFKKIPGSPIAYWVSEKLRAAFESNPKLGELIEPRQGMATTNNNRFLRLWHEVHFSQIGFGFKDSKTAKMSSRRWFPYNKGGDFRKWYGNNSFVVNYYNDFCSAPDTITTTGRTSKSRLKRSIERRTMRRAFRMNAGTS